MASYIRRKFLATVLGGAAAWPLAARAQQGERMRQIAVLMGSDTEGHRHLIAFREGLQALGWADGRNLRTDYRCAAGDADRMRSFAKEVVKQRPEVMLITSGSSRLQINIDCRRSTHSVSLPPAAA